MNGLRGRLAPSPTGLLHLGNAYAFLMSWLSIRQRGGLLALRIEDVDPDRSRVAFADAILQDLDWLGLTCDEGPKVSGPYAPYTQSERIASYDALLNRLDSLLLLYPCYCTRKELRTMASAPHMGDEGTPYPGTCRKLDKKQRQTLAEKGRRPCLRLNTSKALHSLWTSQAQTPLLAPASPGAQEDAATGLLRFTDAALGELCFSIQDCGGDFALRRSDNVVAYQLAVVADDAAMRITEVTRGDDLLLSTPRQILLHRISGFTPPRYAHVPLLHDANGERLAKRHKSLTLAALRAAGARPEGVVGYLAWLAGLRDRPAPARPSELLSCFSFAPLRGGLLRLPEKATEDIVALR